MDLKEENIRLKDALDREVQENMLLKDKIEGLQDRIDSAINYIDKLNEITEFEFENDYWMENLINILKGDNK